MAYTVQITKYGAYRKFSGHITVGELLRSLIEVQSHPEFDSFKYSIVDFLNVETFELVEFDALVYRAQGRGGEFLNSQIVSGLVVTDPTIIELLKTRYIAFTIYKVEFFSALDACKNWVEKTLGKAVLLD
jgi:hypothetical protein